MLDYAIVGIALRVEFELPGGGGIIDVYDVVGFTSSFAVNSIPTAVLSLAVGKLANSLSDIPEFASVHLLQQSPSMRAKVRVYMNSTVLDSLSVQRTAVPAGGNPVDTTPLADIGVPGDGSDMLIFEGNVTGIGRAVSAAGTAVATVHLEHWLANLNYASALSASSDPGNPSDMVFSAVFRARGNTLPASGLSSSTTSWVPAVAQTFVNAASLSDIWGEVLHKWLQTVTAQDPFVTELTGSGVNTTGDTAPILDAIQRLSPNNAAGVPLALDLTMGEDSAAIVAGIRSSLIAQTGTNWVNTTLWGKLIGEWAPEYFFSIIPRISDGLVVPFSGPLSGRPWAVIGNEDYVFVKTDNHIPQLLRGVGIVHPASSASGFNLTSVGSININYSGLAGYYLSRNITTGMLLLKSAPRWLANPSLASQYSGAAEGANNPIETVLDGADIPAVAGAPDVDAAAAAVSTRRFLTKYAHQWYVLESLKGRTGEVAGKIRFDICPGSNVMLAADSAADDSINGVTLIHQVFATVMQVNYIFDVEGQRGGTSLLLSHVHTVSEHAPSSGIVTDKPPMYAEPWRGATMTTAVRPERS